MHPSGARPSPIPGDNVRSAGRDQVSIPQGVGLAVLPTAVDRWVTSILIALTGITKAAHRFQTILNKLVVA